jgi:ATP-binding cassette subfamily C (CFTR/MRP) protein 1
MSDRVLVLDKGMVAEFDTPKALLSNEKSLFTELVNQTGSENAKLLKNMVLGTDSKTNENG